MSYDNVIMTSSTTSDVTRSKIASLINDDVLGSMMTSLINDNVIRSVMTSLDQGWRHWINDDVIRSLMTSFTVSIDALGWIIPFYMNYQLAYMDRALVSFEQCLYKWWAANLKMLMDHNHVISIHLRHRRHQCNLKYIVTITLHDVMSYLFV